MLPFQQFLNYLRYSVTDNVIILASKIGIYLDYEAFKIDLIEAIQANDISRIDYVLAHMNRHHLGFMFLKHISIDERFMLASLEANNFKTIGFKFLNTFHQTHIGRNLIPTKTFATYIAQYGVDEIDMLQSELESSQSKAISALQEFEGLANELGVAASDNKDWADLDFFLNEDFDDSFMDADRYYNELNDVVKSLQNIDLK